MKINLIGILTLVKRECIKFLTTSIQSLFGNWLNAILYILIFGKIIGSKVSFLEGRYSYLEFVFPGVLALNLIVGGFRQPVFSIYLQRFTRGIEEILVAPLSVFDIMTGFILGGLARSMTISVGVYLIALAFGVGKILFFGIFILYAIMISMTFSFLGMIVALWAEGWEQLSIFDIFIITPLTFLGGMFTSMDMIAPKFHWLIKINPMFYFIDAIRYSMLGVQETNPWTRFFVVLASLVISSLWAGQLFSRGYKIKP